MKKKKNQMKRRLIILLCFLTLMPLSATDTFAFTGQVIQRGAVGDDVIELQSRLGYLGFFRGKIDGVFGWSTYWALRNFQDKFGLPVDGFAGATTKVKLVNASKYNYTGGGMTAKKVSRPKKTTAAITPNGFSQNEIQLMANAVHGESRGEPYTGQVAVAAVILNRVESSNFPNTVSGVIFEPGAFTAVADGQIWLTPNATSKKAVLDAINGWDPTGSALYYFNPATATSSWIWGRPQIKKIGKHIFCK
jgi:N-acetylmuramoyl-L-alanine amidase